MRNDTPSATALFIARAIVFAAGNRRYRDLIVPGEAEAYLQTIRGYRLWWAWLLLTRRFDAAQRAFAWVEGRVIRGLTLHFLVRKRAIETSIRNVLDSHGVTQVLVLAAGFDTLCWRLREQYPAVTFIETDHPATQSVKQRVCPPRPNHILVPIDYRVTTLTEAMRLTTKFNAKAPTAVVMEGLLMYLDAAVVDSLFAELKQLVNAPLHLAFTTMDKTPPPRGINFADQSRIDTWWLKRRGEPFVFGIAKATIGAWLNERGWRLKAVEDDEVFKRRHPSIASLPLAVGEYLVLAETNGR